MKGIPIEQRMAARALAKSLGCHVSSTLITEGALYTLVMRSEKGNPKAREFQSWVTKTVLPAIRKDGMYVAGEEKLDPTNDADLDKLVLTVMERLQAKVERLAWRNQQTARTQNLVRCLCEIQSGGE